MGVKDLYTAVAYQNQGIVQKLVEKITYKGGNSKKLSFTDEQGLNAVHKSALIGNVHILKLLLDVSRDLDVRDCKGNSPLHYAVYKGSTECTELLLRSGANCNAQDESGLTSLHIATREGHQSVCQVLLQFRASIRLSNKSGKTPLDFACESGRAGILQLFLQHSDGLALISSKFEIDDPRLFATPLHIAASNGHCDCIAVLLDNGFDVNKETSVGTALHDAAVFGKIEAVRLLIDRGADVHRTNRMGETALDRMNKLVANSAGSDIKDLLQEKMSVLKVRVIESFSDGDPDSLSLRLGEVVTVTEQYASGRWRGTQGSKTGFFPKECVEIIPMRHSKPNSQRYDSFKGRYSTPMKTQNLISTNSDKDINLIKRPSSDGTDKNGNNQNLDFNRFKVFPSSSKKSPGDRKDADQITEEANKILLTLSQPTTVLASEMQVLERWFRNCGLEKYAKELVEAGYDSYTAVHMSGADLAAAGVSIPKDRAMLIEVFHDHLHSVTGSKSQKQFIPTSVVEFLHHYDLSDYRDLVMNSEFNKMSEFLTVTIEDLMELGITKLGHQKRIVVRLGEINSYLRNREPTEHDDMSIRLESSLEKVNCDKEGSLMDSHDKMDLDLRVEIPPLREDSELHCDFDPRVNLENMPRLRTTNYRNDRPVSSSSSGSKGSKSSNENQEQHGSNETLKDIPYDSSTVDRSSMKKSVSPEPDPFANIHVYPGQSLKRQPKPNHAHVTIDPHTSQPILRSDSSSLRPLTPLFLPSLNPRPVPLSTFSATSNNLIRFNKSPDNRGIVNSNSQSSIATTEESEDPYYFALPPEPPPLSATLAGTNFPGGGFPGFAELPAPPDTLLDDTPTDDYPASGNVSSVPPPLPPKRSDSLHLQQNGGKSPGGTRTHVNGNAFNFQSPYNYSDRKLPFAVNSS